MEPPSKPRHVSLGADFQRQAATTRSAGQSTVREPEGVRSGVRRRAAREPAVRSGELTFPVDNSTLGQIVGREFHADFVPGHNSDEVFSHPTSNVGQDLVPRLQFNTKTRIGKRLRYRAIDLKSFFFSHKFPLTTIKLRHREQHPILVFQGEPAAIPQVRYCSRGRPGKSSPIRWAEIQIGPGFSGIEPPSLPVPGPHAFRVTV